MVLGRNSWLDWLRSLNKPSYLVGAAELYMKPSKEIENVNLSISRKDRRKLVGFFEFLSKNQERKISILNIIHLESESSAQQEQQDPQFQGWKIFVSEGSVLDHGEYRWFTESGFVFFAELHPTLDTIAQVRNRRLRFIGFYPSLVE
jgi:hypothetical protein